MKKRLLNYIVCPKCRGKFGIDTSEVSGEEIIEGSITCLSCGKRYPIHKGVPRILDDISEDKRETAEAFGYEWKHFTALTDKYEQQFLDWISPVTQEFFRDKIVLDAGCGKGRHAWLSAKFGAREVMGVDLSEAVEVAFENTKDLPNVHIIQADIYNLPFLEPFDYVYSIGVLHHLPKPRTGFLSLVEHLHLGGRISAWVYGKEGNWWIEKIVNPIRINLTSRLPKVITKIISFIITLFLQLLLKLIYRPVNEISFFGFFKKILFYNDYLYSISNFSFEENYSIVFDHLIAPTAYYLSREEFEEWFIASRLKEIIISSRNNNSWRGTAVKITNI